MFENFIRSRRFDGAFYITMSILVAAWVVLLIDLVFIHVFPKLPDRNIDWVILISVWILISFLAYQYIGRR